MSKSIMVSAEGLDTSQDSTVELALAGGTPQHFGWYRFYFDDERWEWSPEVARIHGYEPATVTPTTRLVLSHKHPEDYEQVAANLEDIRRSLKPFSTRHRVITVQGATRDVVVIGERMHDNAGRVIGTQGATSMSRPPVRPERRSLPKRSPRSQRTGPRSSRRRAFLCWSIASSPTPRSTC